MNPDKDLAALRDLAIGGDEMAASILFMAAFDAVDCLKQVALKNPKVLLPMSRVSAAFPALIVPNKSRDEEHATLIRVCEVGKDSTFNIASTAAMKFDTPPKRLALKCVRSILAIKDGSLTVGPEDQKLLDACKLLPRPCRENFAEWNKVLLSMLPTIDEMALYPDAEWGNIVPKGSTNGQKLDAIKKAVSQALHTILPDS